MANLPASQPHLAKLKDSLQTASMQTALIEEFLPIAGDVTKRLDAITQTLETLNLGFPIFRDEAMRRFDTITQTLETHTTSIETHTTSIETLTTSIGDIKADLAASLDGTNQRFDETKLQIMAV